METITQKDCKEEAKKVHLLLEHVVNEKNNLDEEKNTTSKKWVPVHDMDDGDQDY